MKRFLILLLPLALISCESSGYKNGPELYHRGSAGENTALSYSKTILPGGASFTELTIAKDQQSLLRYLAMLKGIPSLISAGGDAVEGSVDAVAGAIE